MERETGAALAEDLVCCQKALGLSWGAVAGRGTQLGRKRSLASGEFTGCSCSWCSKVTPTGESAVHSKANCLCALGCVCAKTGAASRLIRRPPGLDDSLAAGDGIQWPGQLAQRSTGPRPGQARSPACLLDRAGGVATSGCVFVVQLQLITPAGAGNNRTPGPALGWAPLLIPTHPGSQGLCSSGRSKRGRWILPWSASGGGVGVRQARVQM